MATFSVPVQFLGRGGGGGGGGGRVMFRSTNVKCSNAPLRFVLIYKEKDD